MLNARERERNDFFAAIQENQHSNEKQQGKVMIVEALSLQDVCVICSFLKDLSDFTLRDRTECQTTE